MTVRFSTTMSIPKTHSQSSDESSAGDTPVGSCRSRASSVVSTGTRFSVATRATAGHNENIASSNNNNNADLIQEVLRLAARRRSVSLYSFNTLDHPAPPYHEDVPPLREDAAQPNISDEANEADRDSLSDTDGAISAHYRQIVSQVDRNHQQQLANMLQRIDDIDQAYRRELKARDREVEKVREELETVREEMETQRAELLELQAVAIGKARNQVEDVWETRWKDINRLKAEEMGRLELEGREALEAAVATRDGEWLAALAGKYPHLEEDFKGIKAGLGS